MAKVGFACADITPEPGSKTVGSYRRRVMTGAHDPLFATACVIEQSNTTVAVVGIDCGVIMRQTTDAALDEIAQRTAIPRENILISASHTHAGGPALSTFLAEADPAYAK